MLFRSVRACALSSSAKATGEEKGRASVLPRLVVFSESDWARLVVVGEDDRQQDAGDVQAHALIGG